MQSLPLVDVCQAGENAEAAGLIEAAEEDALALLHAADLLGELSLTLCDAPFIRGLNQQWRGVYAPTDVLSFPIEDEIMLGDLVICVEVVHRQAAERGYTPRDELRVLLVHGLLHLIGYDHEESDEHARQMAELEEQLMKKLRWAGEGLICAAGGTSASGTHLRSSS